MKIDIPSSPTTAVYETVNCLGHQSNRYHSWTSARLLQLHQMISHSPKKPSTSDLNSWHCLTPITSTISGWAAEVGLAGSIKQNLSWAKWMIEWRTFHKEIVWCGETQIKVELWNKFIYFTHHTRILNLIFPNSGFQGYKQKLVSMYFSV